MTHSGIRRKTSSLYSELTWRNSFVWKGQNTEQNQNQTHCCKKSDRNQPLVILLDCKRRRIPPNRNSDASQSTYQGKHAEDAVAGQQGKAAIDCQDAKHRVNTTRRKHAVHAIHGKESVDACLHLVVEPHPTRVFFRHAKPIGTEHCIRRRDYPVIGGAGGSFLLFGVFDISRHVA